MSNIGDDFFDIRPAQPHDQIHDILHEDLGIISGPVQSSHNPSKDTSPATGSAKGVPQAAPMEATLPHAKPAHDQGSKPATDGAPHRTPFESIIAGIGMRAAEASLKDQPVTDYAEKARLAAQTLVRNLDCESNLREFIEKLSKGVPGCIGDLLRDQGKQLDEKHLADLLRQGLNGAEQAATLHQIQEFLKNGLKNFSNERTLTEQNAESIRKAVEKIVLDGQLKGLSEGAAKGVREMMYRLLLRQMVRPEILWNLNRPPQGALELHMPHWGNRSLEQK